MAGPHTLDGKSILLKQKPETDSELMARLAKQVNLEQNYEKGVVSDIEMRLAKLKCNEPSGTGGGGSPVKARTSTLDLDDEELAEEDQVESIMNRVSSYILIYYTCS